MKHLMLLQANSLMFSEAAFLAISLLTYCLCRFIFSNRRKKAGAGDHDHPLPPGPSPWPVVGCLPQMLKASNKYKWIFGLMKDLNTDIACIRIGNVHVIPVTSPEIASEFLKEKDALFASRPKSVAAALISHNYKGTVLSQKGNQWAKMRKMLTADLFSPFVHKCLHDKRKEEADNLVCFVHNQRDGIVDLRKTTLFYSANVIRKLMFNRRYFYEAMPDKGPGVAEEEHADGVLQSLKYVFAFGLSDFFPLLTGIDLDGKEKKAKEANKILEKHQNPIIDERIEKWRGGSTSSEEALEEDMLDIMINLKDSNGEPLLSGEEIKGQINELVIGATDNPSNAVEWVMAEMFNQPHIMQKAIEELDLVVGKDRLVQESDIPDLRYVKACLMEAFRLHPVQPFIPPHFAIKDAIVGGYFIPKGSYILISRYGVGRNPKVWKDPLTFNPERHIETGAALRNILTDPALGFITFGIGRRSCVATTLGTAMTVMLLARLLQAFHWSLPPGVTKVDLAESEDDLFLASPLVARATPRLSPHLYQFENV